MTLLIATRNLGKVREFADLFAGLRVRSLDDFPDTAEVDETGSTFLQNACLKASSYARQTGLHALADDSGLEVDALNGAPGVYSARFAANADAGEGDSANNAHLLAQLQTVPDDQRTARFRCVLALADPDGRILLMAAGRVEGEILRAPRGKNGFGYDPLFLIATLGKTTAELPPPEKHRVSHRGIASRQMVGLMRRADFR